MAAAGTIVFALLHFEDHRWLAVMAFFVAWQAWRGFRLGVTLQGLQPTMNLLEEAAAAMRSGRHDDAAGLFTKLIDGGANPRSWSLR